MVQGG